MSSVKLLSKENVKDVYTLSPLQEGLLFHALLDEDSTSYFQQAAFRLRGPLEVARVEETLQALVDRHDTLRTVFKYKGGDRPLQIVLKEWRADFSYEDLRHLASDEREEFVRRFRESDRANPFDLSRDALTRLAVLQLADDEYEFVWSHHHIIMDGRCVEILLAEFFELYNSRQEGRPSRLPEARPYSLYIKWLESRDQEQARAYWREYLKGYGEAARFPTQKPAPGREKGYLREKVVHTIDAERTAALRRLAAAHQATLPQLLRAVWGLVLARYAGTRDVVFGEVVAGRPPEIEDVESMIGLFVVTIPVRVRLRDEDTFADLLARIRREALAAEEFSYFPLNEIQALSEIEGGLFDHLISFHSRLPLQRPAAAAAGGGRAAGISDFDQFEQTSYDLVLDAHVGDTVTLSFTLNAHVHERSFVERTARVFEAVVDQLLARPSLPVNRVSLMTPEDRALLGRFNATDREFASDRSVARIVEGVAAESPDRTALVFRGRAVSYGELNAQANRLSRLLRSRAPLAADQRVALLMERSDLMVECILAVWKAGAAYVPVDVTYPPDRILSLVRDSEAALVLTDGPAAAAALPPDLAPRVLRLDELAGEIAALPAGNPEQHFDRDSLAYVIYTSGSTGRPKGAMIEHVGMLNHLFAKINDFQIGPRSVVAQNASHCFDISVWQWFAALMVGGRVVIYDNETVLDPGAQAERLAADGVTVFETVPSYLAVMLDAVERKGPGRPFPTLDYMIVNGEVFTPALVRRWFGLSPGVKLVNAYGATEVSDDSNHYVMTEPPPYEVIPLGSTLQNLKVYVADEHMNLCPVGVKGEIMISGVGVGRGYLNDEERTRRAFAEDPFRAERGVRLYKTGDLGRYLDDGRLEFAGRRDYQVKVRGYRIELEEIESVVAQHPSVREAMVIVRKDAGGDDYLACHLAAEGPFDAEALRAFLATKLPHYMIPAHFRVLDALPLNENGKHDRKALMALTDGEVAAPGGETYVAPRDEVEERLAQVWRDVLRVERVGIKDDFFALGGDSFKAIRVVSNFGRGFLVPDLFNHPTVEGLADFMRRNGGGSLSLLYELTPKEGRKKIAVVAVPHSAGDPLVYARTAEALAALSDEYRLLSVALPRPEPGPGETYAQLLRRLAGQVVEEIRKLDMPIIIYGQSNGTGLALEVARWLERERLPLRALVLGGALPRFNLDPRALDSDARTDEAVIQFVAMLGSTAVPQDPADLAIFTRNFRYDSLIAVNAYYNAQRDSKRASFQRLEAPLFSVTGDNDPLTRNYQSRWRDWYRYARRVELVVIEGVGHYLLRDRPEEIARLLYRVGEGDYVAPAGEAPEAAGVLGRLRSMLPRRGRD